MIETIEDTLRGGFGGLYGEVVTEDIYRMRQLDFIPKFIFDVGSNVGVYTRFARELFPESIIICVEPDGENFYYLNKFTDSYKVNFIKKAIGSGVIYRTVGAVNGAHESYLSVGLGYPKDEVLEELTMIESGVETITIDELTSPYADFLGESILKLDCEGGENTIWGHEESMVALSKIKYITGELHNCALHGGVIEEVKEKTAEAFKRLSLTHDIEMNGPNFWAKKK